MNSKLAEKIGITCGLVALCLILVGIFITSYLQLEYCTLCMRQRILFGAMGLGFLGSAIALRSQRFHISHFFNGFIFAAGIVGIAQSAQQTLMQAASGNTIWILTFTIPQWALLYFILFTLVSLFIFALTRAYCIDNFKPVCKKKEDKVKTKVKEKARNFLRKK